MRIPDRLRDWPVYRQLTGEAGDRSGRGGAATSPTTARLRPRTHSADRVVKSVCPYCAVGCGQDVYVKDEKVVQIEGDPDSPVSRGRLCPKGSATLQLTTGPSREHQVLYRRPHGTDWETLDLDTAMDMVAERVIRTRRETWEWEKDGARTARTMGIASLGGATLDNEENYLIKKLLTGLGVVQVENQARVCHSATVAGLGTSFGRGGATTFMQDLQHSDCIVIQGSNFAEAHPVGFQWVMEAKARGARIIHVDPRYTRTSALADLHVPLRAGTDIAFLGGIINHVLTEEKDFREYVLNYTNAATLVGEDYKDTEDLGGVFSGLDEDGHVYDPHSWQYEGTEVQQPTGDPDEQYEERTGGYGGSETHGSGGARTGPWPPRDETLRHPRCVYQVLKRHYARYTPELVEEICGVPKETFLEVCEALTANSGPERTSAFCYAVGWTQHTVGSQYIRAASVLQLLLGNIGRPGGGIQALRGHASIQGSSDIPTLYNLLPGYLPMPHAHAHETLDDFIEASRTKKGFWAEMRSYFVSLLKAYYGEAATPENDFCFDHLPRLTGDHSTYQTVAAQLDGTCKGYFLMGRTRPSAPPTPGCNGSAWPTWSGWSSATSPSSSPRPGGRTAPRSRPGNCAPRTSAPRCSSSPPPRTPRSPAPSPTPTAGCSGTTPPSNPRATRAATCGSCTTSAAASGRSWPAPPTRWTARSSTSPGTTRSPARWRSPSPTRSSPRSADTARTAAP